MYHLWQKVKLYHRPASEIVGLGDFCEEITGLPAPDELTAWMFDSALEYLGRWIDGKSTEMRDGKLVYNIEDLLADRTMNTEKIGSIMGTFGAGEVISLDALMRDERYLEQVRSGKVKPPHGWSETLH